MPDFLDTRDTGRPETANPVNFVNKFFASNIGGNLRRKHRFRRGITVVRVVEWILEQSDICSLQRSECLVMALMNI
jgi:hypothetical protein